MQPVLQRRGDQRLVALLDRPQQHRQEARVAHGVAVGHHGGQYPPGLVGAERKVRRQGHEPQLRVGQILHRVHLSPQQHGGGQPAQQRRSQIVGVALDLRGQGQELPPVKGFARHHVGRHGAGGDQRRGGAQSPAHGDVGLNVDVYRRHVDAPQFVPHLGIGHIGQIFLRLILLVAAGEAEMLCRGEGQGIVKAQGTAQYVKARRQIGGGGRDADGHLLHTASPAFFRT